MFIVSMPASQKSCMYHSCEKCVYIPIQTVQVMLFRPCNIAMCIQYHACDKCMCNQAASLVFTASELEKQKNMHVSEKCIYSARIKIIRVLLFLEVKRWKGKHTMGSQHARCLHACILVKKRNTHNANKQNMDINGLHTNYM